MRASAVVEVGGGKPPVEGGRGVVAPLEGGQTGLHCARGQRLRSQPPRCPVVIVMRLVSATRRTTELSAPRSRRQARDDGRATAGPRRQARDEGSVTHFRAAARHPPTYFRWRPARAGLAR